ncbi:conserved hypothetical protein [Verticillium alfalfae VaMs.102]|uniref:Small ribosomal subunit protein uS7m n=1 Tax=Verticillium alfalfae (strain VaMs.102 / ATCC MYA-4576 / FGSC 10136) TaxID=526221 RepID=C9STA5_VERA1|nr:conserved hypothetical protein [Verticillium alfalfae VaMs.102]EEY22020.1 conserved hypothetical protein [Verticillium alfalfae VaMs.102]
MDQLEVHWRTCRKNNRAQGEEGNGRARWSTCTARLDPAYRVRRDAQRDLEVLASGGGLLADSAAADVLGTDEKGRSYKYPLPAPLPENSKLQARYHPVLEQLTNVMMRHGKKSVAQRNMAMILNHLRTAPAPILSTKNPLMAGHPPGSHFPLNPVMYLTIVIDSVAPLVKVRYIPGAAGGGRALEMPGPLAVRQRRRLAFQWILDAVAKKRSTGSGRTQLAHRIANEIIAIAEGRSGVWEKRIAVHKLATSTRANLTAQQVRTGTDGFPMMRSLCHVTSVWVLLFRQSAEATLHPPAMSSPA